MDSKARSSSGGQSLTTQSEADLAPVPFEQWLCCKELAAHFGVEFGAVLRWWHDGLPTGRRIPKQYMKRRGFRDYLFHPQVIEFIRAEQDRAQ